MHILSKDSIHCSAPVSKMPLQFLSLHSVEVSFCWRSLKNFSLFPCLHQSYPLSPNSCPASSPYLSYIYDPYLLFKFLLGGYFLQESFQDLTYVKGPSSRSSLSFSYIATEGKSYYIIITCLPVLLGAFWVLPTSQRMQFILYYHFQFACLECMPCENNVYNIPKINIYTEYLSLFWIHWTVYLKWMNRHTLIHSY